jgi:hypothetical protein
MPKATPVRRSEISQSRCASASLRAARVRRAGFGGPTISKMRPGPK